MDLYGTRVDSAKMCYLQMCEFPMSNRMPIPSWGTSTYEGGNAYQRGIGSAVIWSYAEDSLTVCVPCAAVAVSGAHAIEIGGVCR